MAREMFRLLILFAPVYLFVNNTTCFDYFDYDINYSKPVACYESIIDMDSYAETTTAFDDYNECLKAAQKIINDSRWSRLQLGVIHAADYVDSLYHPTTYEIPYPKNPVFTRPVALSTAHDFHRRSLSFRITLRAEQAQSLRVIELPSHSFRFVLLYTRKKLRLYDLLLSQSSLA